MNLSKENAKAFEMACRADANLLITGPTGSGKTSLAFQVHKFSNRAIRPFITINLATLHEGTLESELFGHERGAYTGAETRRTGRLEAAHGGTVFLDEIGELAPRLQSRFLEFLQSHTIVPVGSNREIKLDVRVIAATHRDLEQASSRGQFREDLFHRLRVLDIKMKSLRERTEDFDTIVHQVLAEACRAYGRSILRISESVAVRLETHPWPGNIRQLRTVLEYAVLASIGPEITDEDLPPWFTAVANSHTNEGKAGLLGVAETSLTLDYHSTTLSFEREYLTLALSRFQGRISLTARQLGISKTTLLRRIKALGIVSNEAI